MEIQCWEYGAEGLKRVYENSKWMVGVKHWKPANDISNIDCLERHNETDELFVLLAGSCVLLSATEKSSGGLDIQATRMVPQKVYNIPRTLWHNTVTSKDTKLILVEDSATGSSNSDVVQLDEAQRATARKLAQGL
ncbi:MAG: cupin [Spirochaetes bacterium]|nr:cupin [Spirochaetota bacterium]